MSRACRAYVRPGWRKSTHTQVPHGGTLVREALLTPFIGLAAIGLVLSIVVHASAIVGIRNPLGSAAWALHGGVFVVWLPVVIVGNRSTRDVKQRDFWKTALRGCPAWMKRMTYVFGVYAIVNFVLFATLARQNELMGASGHWMAFYSVALAVLYSARQLKSDAVRCPVGHPVSPFAKYCEECGNAIRMVPPEQRS